ncbi:hypothetical protein J8L85_03310 [Maribacter sp. MMG018]|uniref:DUF6168 family protein n=1 Tax=Maribacter sp. MMG018 TaxID=2822688 RepID=UPI001B35E101|nr:DUF6168 family protein [Maribacter sp. MMG018]MBQ4913449.1 hypothetical protein [Maribacter sp. MMG018]
MLKKIFLYTAVFALVGTVSYFLHSLFLQEDDLEIRSILEKTYLFHFLYSLLLVVGFEILSKQHKIFEQLGFIYIGLLVFKIVLFTAMLFPQLMGDQPLPRIYRAFILVPIFIFLSLEVFFVSKIMQRK